MKINKMVLAVLSAILIGFAGCSKKEGCKDRNANNYDPDADKNSGCEYRYAATIDVAGVTANNPNGDPWDGDGTGPDLKVNFGKSSSSGFDYSTNTVLDQSATSLTPSADVQFTNEEWKYEIVDDDLLSASEVIASGTFNPVTQGGSNTITINNGGITIQFNYTVY